MAARRAPGEVGRIHVDGMRRLRATMKRAGEDLSDLKKLHADTAKIVEDRARDTTPLGPAPGHIRDTIRSTGTASAAIVRAGRARLDYAMPLHWGHRTEAGTIVPAQPWISAAAQETAPRWTEVYTNGVQTIVDRVEGTTTP